MCDLTDALNLCFALRDHPLCPVSPSPQHVPRPDAVRWLTHANAATVRTCIDWYNANDMPHRLSFDNLQKPIRVLRWLDDMIARNPETVCDYVYRDLQTPSGQSLAQHMSRRLLSYPDTYTFVHGNDPANRATISEAYDRYQQSHNTPLSPMYSRLAVVIP